MKIAKASTNPFPYFRTSRNLYPPIAVNLFRLTPFDPYLSFPAISKNNPFVQDELLVQLQHFF